MEEPRRMEETRRGVAKMAVDESGYSKTASNMIEMVAGKAKNGWEKVKRMMEGKKVVRTGKLWSWKRQLGQMKRLA